MERRVRIYDDGLDCTTLSLGTTELIHLVSVSATQPEIMEKYGKIKLVLAMAPQP